MAQPDSITYIDAKSRIYRAISKITSFVTAAGEYKADRANVAKHAKISSMLGELNDIRRSVENDLQVMENCVSHKATPPDVVDNKESISYASKFDNLYYELAAFSDVQKISLSPVMNTTAPVLNQSHGNLSNYQLPKRKFPTFSGILTEWQGFEDLFKSILSHAPELPDVERFEYLKTSLSGEALSLIAHLPLTSSNYNNAWEILRARYGNKRDLARIHLDALLAPHMVKSDNASSIKILLTSILEHTAALDNLDFVTRQWSPVLVHVFENHLDYDLRARWELTVGDRHQPTTSDFIEFLRCHVRSAEARAGNYASSSLATSQHKFVQKSFTTKPRFMATNKVLTATTMPSSSQSCPICKNCHSIRKCQVFTDKTPNERFQIVKTHRLCINCLGSGHSSGSCPSKYRCQTCNKSHHTMLHFGSLSSSSQTSVALAVSQPDVPYSTASLVVRGQPQKVVLLSTILIGVCAPDGRSFSLRALLDSGSQASFITEKAASTLMLCRNYSPVNITTFASSTTTTVGGKTILKITPLGKQTPSFSIDALIVPQITGLTPQKSVAHNNWDHIRKLPLADPTYHNPGPVDVLLGADIFPSLLLDGKSTGKPGEPTAIETVFGWVLIGPADICCFSTVTSLCLSVSESLDETIKQFWELEELPNVRHFSPDDIAAENIYQNTTTRSSSGRFMVAIPFRKSRPLLGDSKGVALQRFKALEYRLNRDKNLREQYHDFMSDYLSSGHMELIPLAERENPFNYYIPHHCVLRPDSSTTKLRVVFNASAKTTAGLSLNDSMYTGPKLQPDIQVVLLRARLWKFIFMSDIKQMYRQISVQPSDRDYLRIFWRFSQTSPIEEYRLCTVTYGTSAAPFQAIRTIQELALTDGASWPLAKAILLKDTFVDDILTGTNSEEEALKCQDQLIQLCSSAQFELRKWVSNSTKILQAVPEHSRAMSPLVLFDNCENPELKVLGLKWDPSNDTFSFKTQQSLELPTKRLVLSSIARVFDPLGLLSPTTFWTKHLMQRLWTSGITWDDVIPAELAVLWKRYQSELKLIEQISIPRRVTKDNVVSIHLHAFSDSSEKGYAAAVYLRIETTTSVYCQLITGKSKVAPLKRSTIPRLELCGAVLAARLLNFVVSTFTDRIKIDQLYAWTDSTTALVWIRSSPHRWATFVANRTSQIQELTPPSIWRHVPTQFNPVDCASRGLFPSDLMNHSLWWTGPSFLLDSLDTWPSIPDLQFDDIDTTPQFESKKQTVLLVTVQAPILDVLNRFSSLSKVIRIVAYCLRFLKVRTTLPNSTVIEANEVAHAFRVLIYCVQRSVYMEDISHLNKSLRCSKNLRHLDLFIDEEGIVRVGGRLTNASIPYTQKHPILLPSKHQFTNLLIDHHHHRLKHPGAHALQAYLQNHFWIQSSRKVIRSRVRLCISCFRTRPKCVQPKMAALPKYRVQQIKPFAITGVDYAGPIAVKGHRGRTSSSNAAYICLFVCMNTKALHLEVSSDLSTETFLLAFTRFSARRGPIQEIHSDNGTNFVGASKLLNPLKTFTESSIFQNSVKSHLSKSQISWYFNPPSSPHFGGLWEAGVKSTKSLILRSIGLHKLTSEELITLLVQIEATLNSRPLGAVSNEPTDFEALTPSHFLTLEPPISLPQPCLERAPLSKLQRWRLINDLHRYFWSRWKNEYLLSLQVRTKWFDDGKKLCVGDLVLIKEASQPLHWPRGRISALHPGSDGIARVATVDTASGQLIRPAVKLCPLPIC